MDYSYNMVEQHSQIPHLNDITAYGKERMFTSALPSLFEHQTLTPSNSNVYGLSIPPVSQLLLPSINHTRSVKCGNPRNKDLYKTALCDYWVNGVQCRFGDRCWFAHGPEELRIAQFVVPSAKANPFTNSLDYEIRKGSNSCEAYDKFNQQATADNVASFLDSYEPFEHIASKAVGFEHTQSHRSPSMVNTERLVNCFVQMNETSNTNMMRSSSTNAMHTSLTDDFKSSTYSDSGFGSSWHSPNSTHSLHELKTNLSENDSLENNEYNIWSSSPIDLLLFPKITSKDVTDDKQNEVDLSICELFALCGECPLEDSCCFAHPKND